jgi:hypothetical protein
MLGAVRRLKWRLMDRVDYALTSVRLWIIDRFLGPGPPTDADRKREGDRSVFGRRFPSSRPIIMVKGGHLGYRGQCQDRT